MFDALLEHMNRARTSSAPDYDTPWRCRHGWRPEPAVTDRYAIYNGDCMDVLAALPDESIHLSVYSPPFVGLYHYSSSERDLSNARSYEEFFDHYGFVIDELPGSRCRAGSPRALHGRPDRQHRQGRPASTSPATSSAPTAPRLGVHRPLPHLEGTARGPQPDDGQEPRPQDHRRRLLPLLRRLRRRPARVPPPTATTPIPIEHPTGLLEYAGEREDPGRAPRYRGWTGKQTENRYSHWIWRQYASAFWDDIRIDRVLPFRDARDEDDEKHMHPLQLDVIHRACSCGPTPASGSSPRSWASAPRSTKPSRPAGSASAPS
jgi:hypothetical protein